MRGPGLSDALTETDPLKIGVFPFEVCALNPGADKTALFANQFIDQARRLLANKCPANMILLRGFANFPLYPPIPELFGLHAAAIAINGMYRGVAKLAGMQG